MISRQTGFFDDDEPDADRVRGPDESPAARRRELDRQRQLRWRRRHQFCAPLIEAPDGRCEPPGWRTCTG